MSSWARMMRGLHKRQGIMYLDVPLVMGVQRLYPRQARWSPLAGLLIMCVSLAASSFSQTVTHLIVTQGILYAVGGSIAYSPCIMYMDEWFVRRKGFAYGVMWSGTGLAGVVLPMLLQLLLGRYGFRTTLRIWALALFVLAVPLAFFIRPRLPYSANTHLKPFRLDFVLTRTFLLYQASNIAESLGFFLPAIYLPSYARGVLGASAFPAALTILLLNVAAVFGCVVMGHLTDRLHVATCLLISTAGTAAGVFLLWGLATSLPVLYVFCAIYGLFAGSYTSAYPGIMRQVLASEAGRADSRDGAGQSVLDPAMLFAFLAAGRGVGNVVSGPLSEVLVRGMPWQGQAAAGYGSGYGPLITFTGTSALVGGASYLWRSMGWL